MRMLEAGDEFFEKEQYTKAVDTYERILRRDRPASVKKEVAFKLGESYRKLLNYSKARQWYTVAKHTGYDHPIIYLHLSEVNLGLENFDESIEYAQRYLELHPEDDYALKLLESGKFSRENYYRETVFEVSNEYSINSDGQEWGVSFLENVPVFYDDPARREKQYDVEISLRYNNIIYWALRTETLKERIVFASTRDESGPMDHRTGTGYSSIYQATYSRRTGEWDAPELLRGGINSEFYEGFLSYDEPNQIAYFMNCGGYRGNRETCDIYTAPYDPVTDRWGTPKLFEFNSDEFNIGYPSISDDGKTLYFGSDMPGGYGGYDLYKVKKDPARGSWSEPINLGETINTEFNDAYPFIAGNILYFSSFGHPGFGGFDIYYSVIDEDGNYSEPINMGAPINSSADDFGFIIDEDYTRGFFSSNRPGGSGEDDIYSFRVVPETFKLVGLLIDQSTEEPIPGQEIYVYSSDNIIHEQTTDEEGSFTFPELSPDLIYTIEIMREGYEHFFENISVKDKLIASRFEVLTDYETTLEMISLEKEEPEELLADDLPDMPDFPIRPEITGDRESLPVVHFEFARHRITDEAAEKLDQVVEFMNENPMAGLVIHAHTDEISGYLVNFYISQQRAQSIVEYLVENGIREERLYPFGHGKMELKVRNARTPEEHRLNRRGEFEVLPMEDFLVFLREAPKHSFRYLNSLQKSAHHATGLEFMVQFVATKNPVHPHYYQRIMNAFPDLDIIYYYDKDRFHRYAVGSFEDLKQVGYIQRRLRELGFESFTVAFNNGERITTAEARQLMQ